MAETGNEPAAAEWLAAFRRVVAAHRELFAAVRGIEARTVYEGVGEGGDHSLEIDRRAEDAVFAELERSPPRARASSRSRRSAARWRSAIRRRANRVVIDPIDGSLNARRTIPSHSLSIAVASGESMADVELGFVHDFGADEEFWAERHRGAELDGAPILARGPGLRPRGRRPRVEQAGVDRAGARGPRRQGVPGPGGRLARDHDLLRRRRALRRHALPAARAGRSTSPPRS